MSMVRFPCEHYASLELNQVAFPKTGMVVSQTPLGTKFADTGDNNYGVCENGMWVVADKSKGYLDAPAAATSKPIGIVYTTEKEYENWNVGLKNFAHRPGSYPRVGIFSLGDTVTSNCFQYNDQENGFKATDAAGSTPAKSAEQNMYETLADYANNSVFVVAVAGSPIPKLTKVDPAGSGTYGKVTKFYTMPNGEKGVKYEIINL